jgi:protein gp37
MGMNLREMIGEDRLAKGLWWGKGVNLVTGCTKVSPACDNCWSLKMQERFQKEEPGVIFHEDRLKVFRRKKPTVFSVWTDLFHEEVGRAWQYKFILEVRRNPQHLYLVLTKRPQITLELFKKLPGLKQHFPKNIWLGTTVESNEYLHRIDDLLKLRHYASKLFVSVEPMLGEVELGGIWGDPEDGWIPAQIDGLDLVLCGSESGPNHRPTQIEWIRSLRDQCQAAGVPFFLKQMEIDGKLVKAPELDGRQWLELPEIG